MDTQRRIEKILTMVRFGDDLARLSTCQRKACGAIVFPFTCSEVFAIGYNGPPYGSSNDSCSGEPDRCGCVHAETNAIAKLHRQRALMYSTTMPCFRCAGVIANSRSIVAVLWKDPYRNENGKIVLERAAIDVINIKEIGSDHILKWWAACSESQ